MKEKQGLQQIVATTFEWIDQGMRSIYYAMVWYLSPLPQLQEVMRNTLRTSIVLLNAAKVFPRLRLCSSRRL